MKIYETVNNYSDQKSFTERLNFINQLNLAGIRCNLSKLSGNSLVNALDDISKVFITENHCCELLLDIPYPFSKPRIKRFKCSSKIIENERYTIASLETFSSSSDIILDHIDWNNISIGDIVYYSDGYGAFEVISNNMQSVVVKALNNFKIDNNKSLSFSLFENYDLLQTIKTFMNNHNSLNAVFLLSFVSGPDDIIKFRKEVNGRYSVISKIESMSGLENLDQIAKLSDGLLVARGDLATYGDYSKLLYYTNLISKAAIKNNISIYYATDMLLSLENSYLPNRSEIIDISFITSLGCDKFILSNYIKNIEHVVEVLKNIATNCKQGDVL